MGVMGWRSGTTETDEEHRPERHDEPAGPDEAHRGGESAETEDGQRARETGTRTATTTESEDEAQPENLAPATDR